jgi:hypothetical protein
MPTMFIYNITTKVTWPIHEAWVKWMKEIHIPDIMSSSCFTGNRFMRLLETDEEEGPTYAIQFFAEDKAQYERYIELFAPALRSSSLEKWANDSISFRSLMEVVN